MIVGFSNGSYAKIWDIKIGENNKYADVKLSISRKVKDTGEYRQTFGGFVRFSGNAFEKIKHLKSGDRVKLERVDVESKYVKETKKQIYYFNVWDIELLDDAQNQTSAPTASNDDEDIPF